MATQKFDLNDIDHEPSDEQLAALMDEVAAEARRKAVSAKADMMDKVRQEIAAALHRQAAVQ